MAGICGWLGDGRQDDSEARLADMARGLHGPVPPSASDADELSHARGAAIAAVASPGQAACSHRDGRILAGWVGRIDWSHGSRAHDAREHGDARTLARAWADDGPACLADVHGDVALAVFDQHKNELMLAVDRMGVRSLAYALTPTGAVFASNGRALRAHPDVSADVDPQAVFDFVYFHMVPSPRSIFRGWQKLLPGEYVLIKGNQPEHHRYWQPRYVDHDASSNESALADEYRRTARSAVQSCLDASFGRVGAFLSGGTDSSTIAGLLGELTGAPAETYSIAFDVPGFDESDFAQVAVKHFGTRHHTYKVTPDDVLEAAPRLARDYDEPFGNASAVASLHCAELAKADGIDTLFGGDGGDEIFAGNERYAKQRVFEHYQRMPAVLRRTLVEPIAALLPGNGFPIGKAKSYIRQASIPLPDRLETYNFLTRMSPDGVFESDFLSAVDVGEPLSLLRDRYHEAPTASLLHRLLYLDLKFTLADNDLRKVSRTCEMAGVDVHYPFLDLELVDFANRVAPNLKLKGRHLRYFFKRASVGFLPPEILAKKKHGFGVPCGRWMRDEPPLRELAYDSLASLARRGYVSKEFIEKLKTLHQGEHVDYYGVMVWVLTMLELWHQHHAR